MRLVVLLGFLAAQWALAADWRTLREAANQAVRSGDYAALKAALVELRPLVPGNARNMYNLAAANAKLGETDAALSELRNLSASGVVYDLQADTDFASLAGRPEFAAVLARMEQNRRPVTHARLESILPEPDSIPESIAFDPATRRLLVGNIRNARIISATVGKVFAQTNWPVFALAVDTKRRLLWTATGWAAQCEKCRPEDEGKTALLGYHLDSGQLLRTVQSPVKGVLGDMTIARNGTLYVSEGLGGAVFSLAPEASELERLDAAGEFLSPQTPALSADEKVLYVPDYVRGIAALDLKTRRVTWLQPASGIVLSGIDGLYRRGREFIAIQNGVNPPRVVALSVDLQRQRILESGWPGLGEPTHGVLVGREFYFLTNSGWDQYSAKGVRKPGPPVESGIYRLTLP